MRFKWHQVSFDKATPLLLLMCLLLGPMGYKAALQPHPMSEYRLAGLCWGQASAPNRLACAGVRFQPQTVADCDSVLSCSVVYCVCYSMASSPGRWLGEVGGIGVAQ
jgi:hypothetical protein